MSNKARIAILPFTDLSLNKDHEHFSDGIAEDIINALSKINHLDVISRTSSFVYKQNSLTINEIAKQLKATLIIEGNVRIHQNQIRISTRLIHAKEDIHLWSETWNCPIEDIFKTQDQICLVIADQLREHIGHFEIQDELVNYPTKNLEAYEYYLKGKFFSQKWNTQDINIAIEHYQKSIALDKNNAMAYIGLSECYTILSGLGLYPITDSWAKINQLTNTAHTISPNSPEVHFSFANIRYWTEMDLKSAYISAFKAIEIQPNYARAHQFVALLFAVLLKKEKALEHIEIAYKLNPLSNEVLFSLGYINYMFEDYNQATQWLERTLINNPHNTLAHTIKCCCLIKLNRHKEVLQYFDQTTKHSILEEDQCGLLAMAHLLNGDSDQFFKYKSKLLKISESKLTPRAHGFLFLIYVLEKEFDIAFEMLNPKEEQMSSLLIMLFHDPLAQDLKTDHRFQTIQQKIFNIELPVKKRKKKALMDSNALKKNTNKLTHYITQEKPFLNPDITLRTLAHLVNIHPNQLSWLINHQFNKNFKEFINSYRVDYFKSLVKDSVLKDESVYLTGLAYESGFNSRTAFNSFFKKHTNITPSQYLKSLNKR